MSILVPGPNGRLIEVADPRPSNRSPRITPIAIPVDSRPAHFVLTTFTT